MKSINTTSFENHTHTGIHPSAVVDPSAKIAEHVIIGPNSIVEGNVEIDTNTRIDSCVRLCNGARIGKDCHIYHGAVVGEEPQDLKYNGEETVAVIGDRTQIREYATVHRGTGATKKTEVGQDCLLMAYTHVAHDCILGNHVIMANCVQLGGHVVIDDFVYIGGMSGVHQFTHVGESAFVGGLYRCNQDIPPFILASGEPMKFTGLNVVGLRRRGFSNETINTLKEVYRIIYRAGFNISQAMEQITSGFEMSEEIEKVVTFIQQSKRGIV